MTAIAERAFDFWLGEWEVSWGDGQHGVNRVTALWDGKVIQEQFDGGHDTPLRGMSVSAYDPRQERWQQTWVDNNGTYLAFTGTFQDGRMTLSTTRQVGEETILLQMVWFNISDNELEWVWQRSDDEGVSWTTLWHLRYSRM